MTAINKTDLQKALLNYYTAELKETLLSIFMFEQKYAMSFEDFQQHEATLPEEDFEKADDLIEWKSDRSYRNSLWLRIKELQHGNFQLAE